MEPHVINTIAPYRKSLINEKLGLYCEFEVMRFFYDEKLFKFGQLVI